MKTFEIEVVRTYTTTIEVALPDEMTTSAVERITLGNNLATLLNAQGIKFIAMGPGSNNQTNGVAIYEVLATANGGTTTTSFSVAAVETAITNASDTSALETLYTYTKQEDGSVTRPLGELPTLES